MNFVTKERSDSDKNYHNKKYAILVSSTVSNQPSPVAAVREGQERRCPRPLRRPRAHVMLCLNNANTVINFRLLTRYF